ncbi:MAG: PCRF domain-containing protein, partial [Gammaproteobacteria bacterium]|nr:PCRF domain-containing protein [Gammaproteobacteria bacterium]
MKASIQSKLDNLVQRHAEISALLSDPQVIEDQNRFRTLSIEFADIGSVVGRYKHYESLHAEMTAAQTMLEDADPELRGLAVEETRRLHSELADQE